jgi:hypothetical protein
MVMMSSFRRSVAAETKRRGGGKKGAYYDKMRLPHIATPILLSAGQYIDPNPPAELVETDPQTGQPKPVQIPYFKGKEHKRKGYKNGKEFYADEICSSGLDAHNPRPCLGCYAMDIGDKSMGIADIFAFSIIHFAYYHGHPLIDWNTGQVRMKNDNSGFITVFDECEGRTCNYCRVLSGQQPIASQEDPWPNYRPQDLSTVFGRRRYLKIGKGHLGDIAGLDQIIRSRCATCKSQLTTDGFECPNCQTLCIDMQTDPRKDAEIEESISRPYPCLTCNRPVLLREVVVCEACEARGQQTIQHSMFDVIMNVMRQGEGTNSHIVSSDYQTIEEFERTIDPRWLGGKSLRQYISELPPPHDFNEVLAPRSLQDQSKRFDIPIPQGLGGGVAYGQQPQGQSTPYGAAYPQPQAAPAIPYGGAPGPVLQSPPYGAYPQPAPTPQPPGPTPAFRPNFSR